MGRIWRALAGGGLTLAVCGALVAVAAPAGVAEGSTQPIRLTVNALEAPGHILHALELVPAQAGTLTLIYPKWIPGFHAPNGPLVDVAGLRVRCLGRDLPWRRDLKEPYIIRCEVPAKARTVEVSLDYLIPSEGGRRIVSATPKMLVLDWNQVLFYPSHPAAESLLVSASLQLPPGWRWGTALPVEHASGNRIEFRPASLVTLVDSPVLAGAYFKVVKLAPELPVPHEMDIAADNPDALEMDPKLTAAYERMVREENALFGAHHYRGYHFLVALSDAMGYLGVEHHESSVNHAPERSLVDAAPMLRAANLLSHEMTHSWNGKYRRPADLASAPYLEPQQTDLLWVYEGLTEYLSWVIAARSGLLTSQQSRDFLAQAAATMDYHRGRTWRPLADVAASAPFLSGAGPQWGSWRRGLDYYPEGVLLWLEADAVIRSRTGGQRSLDDFCARFFGGQSGGPVVKTYTLEDVLAELNGIAPYDWRTFFEVRVDRVTEHAPLGGIEGEGWKLSYVDTLSAYERSMEQARKATSFLCSLGMIVDKDAAILDILPEMPAGRAGLAPGMKILAVNSKTWNPETARGAVRDSRKSSRPMEVLAQSGSYVQDYKVEYRGGDRHPVLVRDPGKPDLLTVLLSPKSLRPPDGARISGGSQ